MAGSKSRGTAKSRIRSGRPWRDRAMGRYCLRVTMGSAAPVALITRSASARASKRRSHATVWPPQRPASSAARRGLRLATATSRAPSSFRYRRVSAAISPAPMRSTFLSSKRSKTWRAKSATATLGMLTRRQCRRVSLATRRATREAAWNAAWVSGPVASCCVANRYACFTCERICGSPTTMLSKLLATRNR